MVTLDDKGRLLLPAKIREQLAESRMIVSKGAQHHLWLFPTEVWHNVRNKLLAAYDNMDPAEALFNPAVNERKRDLNAFSELEFDRNNRLTINPGYRELVDIDRRCTIVGMGDHLDIWSEEVFKEYSREKSESNKGFPVKQ